MGGGGLASARRTPSREAVEGAGAEEARGGRGGGKRLRAAGGRGATDAEARDARGGRRLGAAARRGAQETRQARGDPESSMKSPRGRGRGAGLGRLSGGARHSWQGGGRGGVLGVSRGLGGEGRARGAREAGVGQQRLRARPGRARLLGLDVSLRRLLGARRSRQPAAAQFGGFFGNLQMFSERRRGGSEGVTETELGAAGIAEAKAGGGGLMSEGEGDKAS